MGSGQCQHGESEARLREGTRRGQFSTECGSCVRSLPSREMRGSAGTSPRLLTETVGAWPLPNTAIRTRVLMQKRCQGLGHTLSHFSQSRGGLVVPGMYKTSQ